MWYVLICLCLSLAGVAGLQFFYMIYLERIDRERKKRVNELERRAKYLAERLEDAELQICEQNKLLESVYDEFKGEEEVWADVIEER
jgi:hypothetical protein